MTDERLTRCCPSHPDLITLCRHLVMDYAEVPAERVAQEVQNARDAIAFVGLAEEVIATVELVARGRLELVSGRREDVARVDPQTHRSRGSREPVAV